MPWWFRFYSYPGVVLRLDAFGFTGKPTRKAANRVRGPMTHSRVFDQYLGCMREMNTSGVDVWKPEGLDYTSQGSGRVPRGLLLGIPPGSLWCPCFTSKRWLILLLRYFSLSLSLPVNVFAENEGPPAPVRRVAFLVPNYGISMTMRSALFNSL